MFDGAPCASARAARYLQGLGLQQNWDTKNTRYRKPGHVSESRQGRAWDYVHFYRDHKGDKGKSGKGNGKSDGTGKGKGRTDTGKGNQP